MLHIFMKKAHLLQNIKRNATTIVGFPFLHANILCLLVNTTGLLITRTMIRHRYFETVDKLVEGLLSRADSWRLGRYLMNLDSVGVNLCLVK